MEKHYENERKIISKLRSKQKKEREKDPELLLRYRQKQTLSKREQRKRQKEKAKKSNLKISTKKRDGINIRRKGRYELKFLFYTFFY